jgi:hypothetical protein
VGVYATRDRDAAAGPPTAAELGTAVDLPILSGVARAKPLAAGHRQQLARSHVAALSLRDMETLKLYTFLGDGGVRW